MEDIAKVDMSVCDNYDKYNQRYESMKQKLSKLENINDENEEQENSEEKEKEKPKKRTTKKAAPAEADRPPASPAFGQSAEDPHRKRRRPFDGSGEPHGQAVQWEPENDEADDRHDEGKAREIQTAFLKQYDKGYRRSIPFTINNKIFLRRKPQMVKLRLKRMGKKKTPYYRIVVADSRARRDGRFIRTGEERRRG